MGMTNATNGTLYVGFGADVGGGGHAGRWRWYRPSAITIIYKFGCWNLISLNETAQPTCGGGATCGEGHRPSAMKLGDARHAACCVCGYMPHERQ